MIDGFQYLPGLINAAGCAKLLGRIETVLSDAPLYQPTMPRTGKPLSVKMSNCGALGWVCDKDGGYRYQQKHPVTERSWPQIPDQLLSLWRNHAGYDHAPEACLINYYAPGTRMGSHRDVDEKDFSAPVVSISLGDDAVFHIGGVKRIDAKTRLTLRCGDVVILGGAARRAYHGIDRILPGTSDLLEQGGRFNLTLRRVNLP